MISMKSRFIVEKNIETINFIELLKISVKLQKNPQQSDLLSLLKLNLSSFIFYWSMCSHAHTPDTSEDTHFPQTRETGFSLSLSLSLLSNSTLKILHLRKVPIITLESPIESLSLSNHLFLRENETDVITCCQSVIR